VRVRDLADYLTLLPIRAGVLRVSESDPVVEAFLRYDFKLEKCPLFLHLLQEAKIWNSLIKGQVDVQLYLGLLLD
jgi:hypothetical protein